MNTPAYIIYIRRAASRGELKNSLEHTIRKILARESVQKSRPEKHLHIYFGETLQVVHSIHDDSVALYLSFSALLAMNMLLVHEPLARSV